MLNYFKFNSFIIFISIFVFSFIFTGCNGSNNCKYNVLRDHNSLIADMKSSELQEIFLDIVIDLYQTKDEIDRIDSIIITDFVDMHNLSIDNNGRLLTEYLKEALNRFRDKTIVKIDIHKKLILDDTGFKLLTRDKNNIRNIKLKSEEFIINSLSYSDNNLKLFIKRVKSVDSKVVKTVIKEINLNCNGSLSLKSFLLN